MAALTRLDAEQRAHAWVATSAPGAEPVLHEFALGWVISARFPPTVNDGFGIPSMVLDRASGELVVGGTLPPDHIAEWYIKVTGPPPAPDPSAPAGPRRYPATMCQLTISERRWTALSRRRDTDRPTHPVISSFFAAMPPGYRERGCERSAEAAAFSEMLIAEELARAEAGLPPLTLADVRECVRGARVRTFSIREDGDPASGTPLRPTVPVLLLLDYLGLDPDAAPR